MKFSRCLAIASAATLVASASAQAPQSSDQRLATLAKEVLEQQAQIAANHEKIDAKLATLAETVRQARIYSSRGGR